MGFKILAQTSEILTAQTHVKFPLPAFPLSASAKSRNMALRDTEVQSSRQSSDKGNKILSCNSSSPAPEALSDPAVPCPLLHGEAASPLPCTAPEVLQGATRLTAGGEVTLPSHTLPNNTKQS